MARKRPSIPLSPQTRHPHGEERVFARLEPSGDCGHPSRRGREAAPQEEGRIPVNPRPVVADQADVLNCAGVNTGIVMRSMLAATLVIMAAGVSAQAQTSAVPGLKPNRATTVPTRPALQPPADTASAMAQAERQAIQSDL